MACRVSGGSKNGTRRRRDCFAAAAKGPTTLLSMGQPMGSPRFEIVASILALSRAMQKSRVGAMGVDRWMGLENFGMRSARYWAIKVYGGLKLKSLARM